MTTEANDSVLAQSTYSALQIDGYQDAEHMLHHAETTGILPVDVRPEAITAECGVGSDTYRAIVGEYADGSNRMLGVVQGKYRATDPTEYRDLVRAACTAGAKPTGIFALRNGSIVVSTFEVGDANGLRTELTIVDSFNGACRLGAGNVVIRLRCANQLAGFFSNATTATAKHTASLEAKIQMMARAIDTSIRSGQTVRNAYYAAEQTKLSVDDAQRVFDRLWPTAPDDATPQLTTRLDNRRADALKAMANPVNNVGTSLATLWNAATYLVDRTPEGLARACRGGADMLDSMLLGQRGRRIAEVQRIIQTVMADGTIGKLSVSEAREHGLSDADIGASVLDAMLSDS